MADRKEEVIKKEGIFATVKRRLEGREETPGRPDPAAISITGDRASINGWKPVPMRRPGPGLNAGPV